MSFLHRKSGVYHEDVYQEDFDIQRRRRLSKPFTNSSANASTSSFQQLTQKKSIGDARDDFAIPLSPSQSREAIRSHLFTSTSDLNITKAKSNGSIVATLAAKFENNNAQGPTPQLPISSPKMPQHSYTHGLSMKKTSGNHKPSISSLGSKDLCVDNDLGNVSPCSSSDQIADDPAPPARRVASFTPGMATRVPSLPEATIREETESAVAEDYKVVSKKVRKQDTATESTDLWSPPPRENRPETPKNLEYGHIGRLGLGSLHVVNGSTSPAPSEMFRSDKPLWRSVERRDTSSVYPESEIGTIKSRRTIQSDWEDEPLPPLASERPLEATADVHRSYSFRPGSEARFSQIMTAEGSAEVAQDIENMDAMDTTKTMAEEYMAGLPRSPFASSSPPMSLQTPNLSSQLPSSPVPSKDVQSEPNTPKCVQEDASSLWSETSVRRYEDKHNSRRSFLDETLGSSPEPDRKSSPLFARATAGHESPVSFFSVPETNQDVDEQFKSAVELQPVSTRSTSPQKLVPQSPLKSGFNRKEHLSHRPATTKSDSGYSSNTSLSTIVAPALPGYRGESESELSRSEKRGIRFPFRKTVQKANKPVLVKPLQSTRIVAPASAKIESASALTSSTSLNTFAYSKSKPAAMSVPTSPVKPQGQLRRKLQKSRRKSTVEVAGELVVQRLASVECFHIPPVSNNARANLAMRSETLPELERTYRTQHHTAMNPNASTLSLTQKRQDMRFPSPEPMEEEDRSRRSRSQPRPRKRSLSRPRTWFGWSKEETTQKAKDDSSQSNLNDLGSVVNLLGGNPYDIAYNVPRPPMPPSAWANKRPEFLRRRTSPSNITNAHRPRSMMDDEAASNLSRVRRFSGTEKASKLTRRPSFDDRGGVPGKLPHSARLSIDAPPMPPMPTPDEINRRYSWALGYSPQPNPFSHDQNLHSEPLSIEEPAEDPPPPPPHSPRPQIVEDRRFGGQLEGNGESYFQPDESKSLSDRLHRDYQQGEASAIPPPPPSHSPRPVDITEQESRSRDISWTSQVNAWDARRQSAGAALQDSWQHTEYVQQSFLYKPVQRKPLPRKLEEPQGPVQTAYTAQSQRNGMGYSQHPWQSTNHHQQNDFAQTHGHNQSVVHSKIDYDDYSYDTPPNAQSPMPGYQEYIPYSAKSRPTSTHHNGHHAHKRAQTWDVQDEWQAVSQQISPTSSSPHSYNYYSQYNSRRAQPLGDAYDNYQLPINQHARHSRPISRHNRKSVGDELYLGLPDPFDHTSPYSQQGDRYPTAFSVDPFRG